MKSETKWERIARVRAEFAAYVADGGTMSQAEWTSAQHTVRVEAAEAAKAAREPTSAPAPAPTPAKYVFVDRTWEGGDKDSDDITIRR